MLNEIEIILLNNAQILIEVKCFLCLTDAVKFIAYILYTILYIFQSPESHEKSEPL